jgi:serine/threonine protein kinase
LKSLKQENILNLIKFDDEKKWIMTELLAKRDLFDLISMSSTPFDESIARYIFKKITFAVEYSHSVGIVHRDIKLENVLINEATS